MSWALIRCILQVLPYSCASQESLLVTTEARDPPSPAKCLSEGREGTYKGNKAEKHSFGETYSRSLFLVHLYCPICFSLNPLRGSTAKQQLTLAQHLSPRRAHPTYHIKQGEHGDKSVTPSVPRHCRISANKRIPSMPVYQLGRREVWGQWLTFPEQNSLSCLR